MMTGKIIQKPRNIKKKGLFGYRSGNNDNFIIT